METDHDKSFAAGSESLIGQLLKKITEKVLLLFEPEEVEVTFENEGKSDHYTYKVIHHNRAA